MEIKDTLTTDSPKWSKNILKYKDVIVIFAVSRILFGIILFMSNNYSSAMSLFDGEHYQRIAQYGYEDISLTAFFPLIPIIIRLIGTIGLTIVNQICFFFSLVILKKLKLNSTLLLTVALSPLGFFSILLYTESIFFFLTLLSYYLYINKKPPIVIGIVLGLSVFTRSSGAMLFFAIFIAMCIEWVKKNYKLTNIIITYIPATLIALIYPVFLQVKFNNWKSFVDVQYDYWVRIPSNLFSSIITSIQMLFTDKYPFIDYGDMLLARFNEAISLLLLVLLLALAIISIVKNKLNTNQLILSIYIILSVIAINSTIRDPYLDAPTVSFYRYYYEIFALFLLLKNAKPMAQRLFMYLTILIAVFSSLLFSLGIFFY